MADTISQASVDLIVREEVSSKEYYEKHYRHPECPGGHSGITFGIGYDIGQNSPEIDRANMHSDWDGRIWPSMLFDLDPCCGVNGESAHRLLPSVQSVDIPWDVAYSVFTQHDAVKWTALVQRSLPNTDKLHPDCLGALVSLAYNRGASFSTAGDRYEEMRNIKKYMVLQQFSLIPGEFRAMKRLWTNGLVGRREREALLFERGMKAMAMPPPLPGAPTPKPLPPIPTQQDMAIKKAINTGGSGSVITTTGTLTAGLDWNIIIAGICVCLAIGVVIYLISAKHSRLGKADPQ